MLKLFALGVEVQCGVRELIVTSYLVWRCGIGLDGPSFLMTFIDLTTLEYDMPDDSLIVVRHGFLPTSFSITWRSLRLNHKE